jgi:hypothetical protein
VIQHDIVVGPGRVFTAFLGNGDRVGRQSGKLGIAVDPLLLGLGPEFFPLLAGQDSETCGKEVEEGRWGRAFAEPEEVVVVAIPQVVDQVFNVRVAGKRNRFIGKDRIDDEEARRSLIELDDVRMRNLDVLPLVPPPRLCFHPKQHLAELQ